MQSCVSNYFKVEIFKKKIKKNSSSHADLEERSLGVGQAEIKERGRQWARLERRTDPLQLFPSYE